MAIRPFVYYDSVVPKMKLFRRDRWKRIYLLLLASTSVLTAVCLFEGQAGPKQQTRVKNTVRVTIAADKTKIRSGETLTLRVQIWNQGTESVYVATDFDGPDNALARLKINLFRDGSPVEGSTERSAGDYGRRYAPGDNKRPSLAQVLSKYWVALAPRHFYGGDLVVAPSSLPGLNAPGKYMLRGTYTSAGFLGEGMNNSLAGYIDELRDLPFQAWVGEVETNKVWVEVIERER